MNIPAGFKRVTKEQFFSALSKDARDIMPRLSDDRPYEVSIWETKFRVVWGWTFSPLSDNPRAERIYAIKL